MSELLLCGRVTEHDGDIVSVCLWSVAEFVPLGSPEHRAIVEEARIRHQYDVAANEIIATSKRVADGIAAGTCQCSDAHAAVCRNNPKLRPSYCRVTAEENTLRILPVEEVMPNAGSIPARSNSVVTGGSPSGKRESERAKTWRWLVWALAGFWIAVLLAALWRKL